jgi:transcriptional regulator with XRE-family HTH domain
MGETIMNEIDIRKLIGKNLRFFRTRTFKETRNKAKTLMHKPMTQEALAIKVLDVTFQQIQKYENGINGLDSIKLYKLSKFFGVPMEYFFDEHLIANHAFTKLLKEENVQQ